MNPNTEKPKLSIGKITFFPVPTIESFAPESAYLPRRSLPIVPKKYEDAIDNLFFKGGVLPEMSPLVDRQKAANAISEWLSSWSPAHEAKIITAAYALWVWCEGDLTA